MSNLEFQIGSKAIKAGKIKKSLVKLQKEFAQQLYRQIEAIERGEWYLKPDHYGREHTNMTNLTSELRQFVTYHGEPMENVDTVNSQPVFLGFSLKNSIEEGTTTQRHCSALLFCISCREETEKKEEEQGAANSALLFCKLCTEMIPLLTRWTSTLSGAKKGSTTNWQTITGLPRGKVKKEMFAGVLFNRERGWQNRTAKAFEAEFPNIKQELVEMKAHGYQKVAHAMQRTEAAFMFGKVVPRLLQENPQMPVFTLHDSVLTTPHYSQYVQAVMEDEFRKLGINAKVRIEPCAQTVAA